MVMSISHFGGAPACAPPGCFVLRLSGQRRLVRTRLPAPTALSRTVTTAHHCMRPCRMGFFRLESSPETEPASRTTDHEASNRGRQDRPQSTLPHQKEFLIMAYQDPESQNHPPRPQGTAERCPCCGQAYPDSRICAPFAVRDSGLLDMVLLAKDVLSDLQAA